MNMASIWVIIFGILVFGIQFFLCCRTKKTMIRLIPAMAIAVGFIACAIVYLLAGSMGTSLLAVVDLVVLAILLGVDALGWFAYCVFWFIQKIR